MKARRLSVGPLQIYFGQDGDALFFPTDWHRAAVEQELAEYREFIDRWIDVSEEPKSRKVGSQETTVP